MFGPVNVGSPEGKSINEQTPIYDKASSLANLVSGEKLSVSFGKIAKAIADLIPHLLNKSNPHSVTALQVGAARIAFGSYVGTGGYGSDEPNTLSFDFGAKLVIVMSDYYKNDSTTTGSAVKFLPMIRPQSTAYSFLASDAAGAKQTLEWLTSEVMDENGVFFEGSSQVSWYHASSATSQLNNADYTYRWIAIG